MFEPSTETWTNLFQFEQQLAKYFEMCHLEAQIIKSVEGGAANRFMYIKKKEAIITEKPNPVGRPESMKTHVNDLRTKKIKAPERDFGQNHQLKVIK
jgi:hypothetical protein